MWLNIKNTHSDWVMSRQSVALPGFLVLTHLLCHELHTSIKPHKCISHGIDKIHTRLMSKNTYYKIHIFQISKKPLYSQFI